MTIKIITGDALHVLKTLPPACVNCCVTSPPYWGMRDYGVEGQLGAEATHVEYVDALVAIMREVRRVLRDDGTLWLNLGDCYAAARGGTHMPAETLAGGVNGFMDGGNVNRGRKDGYSPSRDAKKIGLKHKDLCMIPARVALALQADGWWLRSEIVWVKPNPMPESVTDRPTCAHEKIFLLSKSAKYFYDADAIAEDAIYGNDDRVGRAKEDHKRMPTNQVSGIRPRKDKQRGHSRRHAGFNERLDKAEQRSDKRNKRNVWTVATHPYSGAHFATFPPGLIEPCILAGCPKGGTVLDPFFGAGTTGLVADRLGRNCIGIELNPDYAALAHKRIADDAGLFQTVEAE